MVIAETCRVVSVLGPEVPLPDWITGAGTPEAPAARNPYDRIAHFSYGLLFTYPLLEVAVRMVGARGFWRSAVPVSLIVSTSVLYEFIEWFFALTVGGAAGTLVLGTQGSFWDTHWDLLLASAGSLYVDLGGWIRVDRGLHGLPAATTTEDPATSLEPGVHLSRAGCLAIPTEHLRGVADREVTLGGRERFPSAGRGLQFLRPRLGLDDLLLQAFDDVRCHLLEGEADRRAVGTGLADRGEYVVGDPALEGLGPVSATANDRGVQPRLTDDRDRLVATRGAHNVSTPLVVIQAAHEVVGIAVFEDSGDVARNEPRLAIKDDRVDFVVLVAEEVERVHTATSIR